MDLTRRYFCAALASLLTKDISAAELPHFAPKAKRVIFLFQ